ncbi:C1 family peptidase [Sphingomonas sp. GlSt437]|uniref:C1 family peptidase n=1 Tax=Sphingomonas sp. GlSt437 TaxID=3389970 RepID=UPI003A846B1D
MIDVHVDLRPHFGPARDQGARPTCLAFAASDTHAGLREGWAPLSCEYAFYRAQQRAGRSPLQGAVLPAMLDALRFDGQPDEQGWPYAPTNPADPQLWKPPTPLGTRYGRNGAAAGIDLGAIVGTLDQQRPMMLLTMLSRSFYRPDGEGVVTPANDELPDPDLRHAVIAVGHGTVNGATAILIRNSWGLAWGVEGHAWLTAQFLGRRLFAAANLLEEVDVSSSPLAA